MLNFDPYHLPDEAQGETRRTFKPTQWRRGTWRFLVQEFGEATRLKLVA